MAIAEAFLRLVVERGYEKVSIRQIVSLAGVGIGSFYEYFSGKPSVAAVCVHLHIKGIAKSMRDRVERHRDDRLPSRVDALVAAQVEEPLAKPEQWAAIFLIERQVSPIEAYRRTYAEFVKIWESCLAAGPDWPTDAPIRAAALTAHSIVYGLVSQSLIAHEVGADIDPLHRDVRQAVHGYLSVLAPHAYRAFRFT